MNKVRIVKVDDRNFGVQEYRDVEIMVDKKRTGEFRKKWVDVAYYGPGTLEWAAKCALLAKVKEQQELIGEFKSAVAGIVEETKKALK